jgi:hypothetical protein
MWLLECGCSSLLDASWPADLGTKSSLFQCRSMQTLSLHVAVQGIWARFPMLIARQLWSLKRHLLISVRIRFLCKRALHGIPISRYRQMNGARSPGSAPRATVRPPKRGSCNARQTSMAPIRSPQRLSITPRTSACVKVMLAPPSLSSHSRQLSNNDGQTTCDFRGIHTELQRVCLLERVYHLVYVFPSYLSLLFAEFCQYRFPPPP